MYDAVSETSQSQTPSILTICQAAEVTLHKGCNIHSIPSKNDSQARLPCSGISCASCRPKRRTFCKLKRGMVIIDGRGAVINESGGNRYKDWDNVNELCGRNIYISPENIFIPKVNDTEEMKNGVTEFFR